MKRYIFFLLIPGMLACTSCSVPEDKGVPKPDTLLAMKEMQVMMTEICQLEARLRVGESSNTGNREELGIYGRQQLDTLLQQHGIGWETWKANFNYYMSRRILADTLMARVTAKLAEEETIKNEALRKTLDTVQDQLTIPLDAEWGEIILF